jgi:hypothetical protein
VTRNAPGAVVLLLMGLAGGAKAAAAQVVDTTTTPVEEVVVTPGVEPEIVQADSARSLHISPRQSFIRSMILPGWGQAEFGSYLRGGVFFAGWAGNWFMIFRNQTRLGEARGRYDRRVDALVDEIAAASEKPFQTRARLQADPVALDQAVRADVTPGGADELRKLVRAREQQREDWIAWSIFWILASGIDGYVTAHLADFPADIDVRPGERGQGSVSVGVDFALPVRP